MKYICLYEKKQQHMDVCSIDSSKAFDKVWRMDLFYKLINRIQMEEWRTLNNYYEESFCYV